MSQVQGIRYTWLLLAMLKSTETQCCFISGEQLEANPPSCLQDLNTKTSYEKRNSFKAHSSLEIARWQVDTRKVPLRSSWKRWTIQETIILWRGWDLRFSISKKCQQKCRKLKTLEKRPILKWRYREWLSFWVHWNRPQGRCDILQ